MKKRRSVASINKSTLGNCFHFIVRHFNPEIDTCLLSKLIKIK